MRRHSPYNYAFNNPVFFIDPDGMAPDDWFTNTVNGEVIKIKGVSDLSQLTDYQLKKYNLGPVDRYERLGKDNMFGNNPVYVGYTNVNEKDFVNLRSESGEFMKSQGYLFADRVEINERQIVAGGRIGQENFSSVDTSLNIKSISHTYVKPNKIDTRENEFIKKSEKMGSSITNVNYDYIRKGTEWSDVQAPVKNTYFYENKPNNSNNNTKLILGVLSAISDVLLDIIKK